MDQHDGQERGLARPRRELTHNDWPVIPNGYELILESRAKTSDGLYFWEKLWILWKYRWILALTFLAAMSATMAYVYQLTPQYTSIARLEFTTRVPDVLPFKSEQIPQRSDPMEDYAEVFHSRKVAEIALDKMKENGVIVPATVNRPPRKNNPWTRLRTAFGSLKHRIMGIGRPPSTLSRVQAQRQMEIDAYLDGLTVQPIRQTNIIELVYTSTDPRYSAEALNALCDAYVQFVFNSKFESYDSAMKWLKGKMGEIKKKLEASEEELFKFEGVDSEGLVSLSNNADSFFKELQERRAKLVKAEEDFAKRESEVELLKGKSAISALSDRDLQIDRLRAQLASVEVDYDRAIQNLGPEMAEVKSLGAAKAKLAKQLADARKQAFNKAQFDLDRARAEMNLAREAYESQKKEVLAIQEKLSKYNILFREVQVNKAMYDDLMKKWKEISVAQGLNISNVTILQRPEMPLRPNTKRRTRICLLGLILSMSLGVGMVFMRDYMDLSVRNAMEVHRLTQYEILGHVPYMFGAVRRKLMRSPPELVTHTLAYSGLAENFRHLRTSIKKNMIGKNSKTIMMVSCLPKEGKTTVSVNLATAFAQRGHRVLLIDGDLRKPSLHGIFSIEQNPGLSDLLGGKALDEDPIFATHVPNLFLLPSGAKVHNPSDLLDSDVFHDLLRYLGEEYDYIFIDSEPIMDISDTNILIPLVDEILLIVQPGLTPRDALIETRRKISALSGNVMGVLLNFTRRNREWFYPVHRYYRHHWYGRHYASAYEDYSPKNREEPEERKFLTVGKQPPSA